jgi:hypothetical protein
VCVGAERGTGDCRIADARDAEEKPTKNGLDRGPAKTGKGRPGTEEGKAQNPSEPV